jgi:thioredoxin 1
MSKLHLAKYGAVWCGPCKAVDAILDELDTDEDFVTEIKRYDIDEIGAQRCQELGLRSVPVLHLVDEDGNVVKEHVGIMPKDDLIKFVDEA